jgi:hypothetical protein
MIITTIQYGILVVLFYLVIRFLYGVVRKKTKIIGSGPLTRDQEVQFFLNTVFFWLIVMQLIFLNKNVFNPHADVDGITVFFLPASILVFIIVSFLYRKRSNALANLFLSLVSGFYASWVISWTIFGVNFIVGKGKLACGGDGEGLFAFILLITGTFIGLIVGFFRLMTKS